MSHGDTGCAIGGLDNDPVRLGLLQSDQEPDNSPLENWW